MPKALSFARLTLKLALGLAFLYFLLGYQPTYNFPHFKASQVHAESSQQSQNVDSKALPIVFQLPHPGYITTHFSSWHPGVDLATGFGMPIHPIAEGMVTNTEFNFFGYGMMVVVDHGHGYQSLYAHMNRIFVQKGQHVSEGDLLGEVGLTGRTTGPHTHLEVSKNGSKIDPLTILPEVRQNPEAQDFVSYAKPSTESTQLASPQTQVAKIQGGPTQLPTLGNTKIQPESSPAPLVKKEEPKTTQPLTLADKFDIEKLLSAPAKPNFLSF